MMIRKATIKDVKIIFRLLKYYSDRGELLPRPLSALYDHLRNFSVCQLAQGGEIVGCVSLAFCWEDLAEIRSLAVDPGFTGRGFGSALVRQALKEAEDYQVKKIFTLTYRPVFFEKFGFEYIKRTDLPLKIWGDCLLCVKFPDCDETAMMKRL